MDYSQHLSTQLPELEQLVAEALCYLKKLDYDRRSLRRYRTTWNHFIAFAREHGADQHTTARNSESDLSTTYVRVADHVPPPLKTGERMSRSR